jgi:phospholipase/lecithinase/hemolysin
LWFFGDSLSDTRNALTLTTFLSSLRPDLIPVPFPSPPYALGHFSNGQVWVEPLAATLGFPNSALAAGLSLGPGFGNALLPGAGGHNFAIAGARTAAGGSFDPFGIPTGLQPQLDLYLAQTGGQADPQALYVVLAGGNDIRDAALPGGSQLTRLSRTKLAAEAYREAIRRLISAGARHIVAGNVTDVGLTPEARYLRNNAEQASQATRAFNRAVTTLLDELEQPGVTIVRLDFFRLGKDIVEDATENGGAVFGITNVDTPCLDVSSLFPDVVIPGAGTVACNVSMFTDDLHPTDAVHHLMAATAAACQQHATDDEGSPPQGAGRAQRLLRYCQLAGSARNAH